MVLLGLRASLAQTDVRYSEYGALVVTNANRYSMQRRQHTAPLFTSLEHCAATRSSKSRPRTTLELTSAQAPTPSQPLGGFLLRGEEGLPSSCPRSLPPAPFLGTAIYETGVMRRQSSRTRVVFRSCHAVHDHCHTLLHQAAQTSTLSF